MRRSAGADTGDGIRWRIPRSSRGSSAVAAIHTMLSQRKDRRVHQDQPGPRDALLPHGPLLHVPDAQRRPGRHLRPLVRRSGHVGILAADRDDRALPAIGGVLLFLRRKEIPRRPSSTATTRASLPSSSGRRRSSPPRSSSSSERRRRSSRRSSTGRRARSTSRTT